MWSNENCITESHPIFFHEPKRLDNILIVRGVLGLEGQADDIVQHLRKLAIYMLSQNASSLKHCTYLGVQTRPNINGTILMASPSLATSTTHYVTNKTFFWPFPPFIHLVTPYYSLRSLEQMNTHAPVRFPHQLAMAMYISYITLSRTFRWFLNLALTSTIVRFSFVDWQRTSRALADLGFFP
jgi:hypothetical protein